jgi:hypothetical protein
VKSSFFWYQDKANGLGDNFLDELELAYQAVNELPQTSDFSDIDIVIDMEKNKKNLHNFLALKRLLEADFDRSVDLGLHHTLKPASICTSLKF